MAQAINFYTAGIMTNVDITSVTSEVAGHEIEFAFDNNLDTFWKATSATNQDIIMDFGVGNTITPDAFALFLRNYNTFFFLANAAIYYSDNGTDWTQFIGFDIGMANVQSNGVGFEVAPSTQTHRYWKILMNTIGVIPEIAHFALLRKHAVATGNIHPELTDKRFAVKKQSRPGTRVLKHEINRIAIDTFSRTWLLTGDDDRDALISMWDNTRGHGLPLFMQEDADDVQLVEIVAPEHFNENKIQNQLYRPTIMFRTLPYIEDGENF